MNRPDLRYSFYAYAFKVAAGSDTSDMAACMDHVFALPI